MISFRKDSIMLTSLRPVPFSRCVAFTTLLCASAVVPALAPTPRPMTLVDIINVPQVSDPQLSTDGRQILFVQSQADWKANHRISHIWKINADGSGLAQMTAGADGETSPRWSPDDKTIAF